MGLFEWGEKRFARGISRSMIRTYKLLKVNQPNLNEKELIKVTLSTRFGTPAQEISKNIDDLNFWEGVVGKSFVEVCFLLIRMEYVEYMNGTLDVEDRKTIALFRNVLDEEIRKADL